jgi:hypothetical protein
VSDQFYAIDRAISPYVDKWMQIHSRRIVAGIDEFDQQTASLTRHQHVLVAQQQASLATRPNSLRAKLAIESVTEVGI